MVRPSPSEEFKTSAVFPRRTEENGVKVFVDVVVDVLVDVSVVLVPDSSTVADARTIVNATKRPSSAVLAFNVAWVGSPGAS